MKGCDHIKVYIIIKEDHGYQGYGRDLGDGCTVESIHKSLEDARFYLQGYYENLYDIPINIHYQDDIKEIYRYYDGQDEHAYEFTIFEKELA